jgi:hypothetical protein
MSQKIVVGDRVELVNSGTLHRSGTVTRAGAIYYEVKFSPKDTWKVHRLNLRKESQ